MPILKVENLSINYGEKKVVKNCSFSSVEGEIIVILGASGDGKTSLLKAISGLLPIAKGTINYNGEQVLDPTQKLVPGHDSIKLVNQDFGLDEFHTVEENIHLRLLQFDENYRAERTKKLLRLTGLTEYGLYKANTISGGQRQRLAIARALADEPTLILLDEPFNQLDFPTKNKISKHIRAYLKRSKINVIMVTHNGIEAMEWADRILFMKNGRVERSGTPKEFYDHPRNRVEASFFGIVNRIRVKNEVKYFRPASFAEKKETSKHIELKVSYKRTSDLGWYSAYDFLYVKQKITLYSVQNISHLRSIFIKEIEFND